MSNDATPGRDEAGQAGGEKVGNRDRDRGVDRSRSVDRLEPLDISASIHSSLDYMIDRLEEKYCSDGSGGELASSRQAKE